MGIIEALKGVFRKGKTLYFPGCTTRAKLPHIAQNYEALLKSIGVPFVTLKETVCCGGFCRDAGYRDDFEKCREKNMQLFAEHQITNIITSDPFCYRIFQEQYAIAAELAIVVLAQHLKPAPTRSDILSYHDACFLAKHKNQIITEPRKLLEQKGCVLQEFSPCKENAQCCGAGGLLPLNNPHLAKRIAERLGKSCPSGKIVTASPLCYLHLKQSEKEVLELSEVLS